MTLKLKVVQLHTRVHTIGSNVQNNVPRSRTRCVFMAPSMIFNIRHTETLTYLFIYYTPTDIGQSEQEYAEKY